MYRGSNERYSENPNNGNMGGYPPPPPGPHHSVPKMHLDGYPGSQPPPYYDPREPNNNFEYFPNNDNFQRGGYGSWRDPSESKGSYPPNNSMGPSPLPSSSGGHYDSRLPGGDYSQGKMDYPQGKMGDYPQGKMGDYPQGKMDYSQGKMGDYPQGKMGDYPQGKMDYPPAKMGDYHQGMMQGNPQANAPVNVVQRISGLIKSQLRQLQGILSYAERRTGDERVRKDRSRSRSRERPERGAAVKPKREWDCPKCFYLNFDFRDRCKKCNQQKPEREGRDAREARDAPSSGGKTYVPGPDDWRCIKCNNINYARRTECHRCHIPRGK